MFWITSNPKSKFKLKNLTTNWTVAYVFIVLNQLIVNNCIAKKQGFNRYLKTSHIKKKEN